MVGTVLRWIGTSGLLVVAGGHAATLSPPPQRFALEFGSAQIAVSPPDAQLDLGQSFSMLAWVFVRPGDSGAVMGRAHDPRGEDPYLRYALHLLDDLRPEFGASTGSPGSYANATSPDSLASGSWHHLAATVDGTAMSLYVNGVLSATSSLSAPPAGHALPFAVGGLTQGGEIGCCFGRLVIAHASVWSRALAVGEIVDAAGNRLTGTEAGLIAYWPMGDGAGSIARDEGPSGLHLEFQSAAYGRMPRWVHTAVVSDGPHFVAGPITEVVPAASDEFRVNHGRLLDVDADGLMDLVVTQTGPTTFEAAEARVFRNDGAGQFTDASASAFVGAAPTTYADRDHAVADFDNDARQDLFIAEQGPDAPPFPGGYNLLLMQQPDGRLQDRFGTSGMPDALAFSHCTTTADFDRSGSMDLFVGTVKGHPPMLLMNDGSAQFEDMASQFLPAGVGATSPTTTGPPANFPAAFASCAATDIDADGDADLVLGYSQDQEQARDLVLVNDGTARFSIPRPDALPPRSSGPNGVTSDMVAADVDGDGYNDIFANVGSADLSVPDPTLYLNNGDGTFRDATDALFRAASAYVKPQVLDINADGLADIIIPRDGEVVGPRVLLSAGEGRFVDASELLPLDAADIDTKALLPADLDGDGLLDLLLLDGGWLRVLFGLKRYDGSAEAFTERVFDNGFE